MTTFSRLLTHASILLAVFGVASVGIHAVHGVIRANAFGTGLSPYGPSPQAVSSASPLPSLPQGENK